MDKTVVLSTRNLYSRAAPSLDHVLPRTQCKTFDELPTEMREGIFNECFKIDFPKNTVPAFIIALRPLKGSYRQALQMLYARYYFSLDWYDNWSLYGMSHNALAMITRLEINAWQVQKFPQ